MRRRKLSARWLDKERLRRLNALQWQRDRLNEQQVASTSGDHAAYLAHAIEDVDRQIERLSTDYLKGHD